MNWPILIKPSCLLCCILYAQLDHAYVQIGDMHVSCTWEHAYEKPTYACILSNAKSYYLLHLYLIPTCFSLQPPYYVLNIKIKYGSNSKKREKNKEYGSSLPTVFLCLCSSREHFNLPRELMHTKIIIRVASSPLLMWENVWLGQLCTKIWPTQLDNKYKTVPKKTREFTPLTLLSKIPTPKL